MNTLLLLFISILPLHPDVQTKDSVLLQQVQLEEVVISSFKQHKTYRMSPVSATVLTQQTLQQNHFTGMKDFSAFVPNVFIPDYGSKLTSPIYIRGIGSKINAPSVGLYVDDMPFFEKAAFDFNTYDVERIEVLSGPQGTLYGRNTMGGIINVYTKSPRKYQGTQLQVSQGNYGLATSSISHYGKLNSQVGYSLSGNYSRAGGYFTNTYNNTQLDELDEAATRFRLEWEANKRLHINVISSFDYTDQGGYPYAEYHLQSKQFEPINYDHKSLYRRSLATTGVHIKYQGDTYIISSQSSFQYLSDKQGIDQDFSALNIFYVEQKQRQRMVSEEWNIKSRTPGNYQWLLGAFAFYQNIDNLVDIHDYARVIHTEKRYDLPTYGLALYHQSNYDKLFVSGLSASAGIRLDYEKASSDYLEQVEQTNLDPSTTDFNSKLSFKQLTPKFTLQYTLPSTQLIYATVSKGYKTGGFNLSFDRDEDRSFKPEHSWNWELGSKLHFFDRLLEANIAAFFIDWKNQQIPQLLPIKQQGTMLKNAGRSENKGVELSLKARPYQSLELLANWGYTHAVFKEYTYTGKTETTNYANKHIPFVPKSTYTLAANYTWRKPGFGLSKISLNTHYIGTGTVYWNDNNRLLQSSYGLLHAKLIFSKKNVDFSLWSKNITNTKYATFIFELSNKYFAQQGKPFTFGADINISL